jgi:outer membrane lipoprotein-sorting protein
MSICRKRGIASSLAKWSARRLAEDGEFAGRVRALVVLASLLAGISTSSYAFQASAGEILNKVSDVYQHMHSYQFVADEISEVAAVGENRSVGGTVVSNFHNSTESRIDLSAIMPGKVRLAVKDEKLDIVLISDGQKIWTYLPKRKRYTEAMGGLSQATDTFHLVNYWNLIVGRFRGASQMASIATLEGEGHTKVGRDEVDCYIIKAQAPEITHEMWVDKTRFIVLRFKQTPTRPLEGMALQTTITVNMTVANVDANLDDGLFNFAPPPNVTKVASLK